MTTKHDRMGRSGAGFTLLELMIAASVLVIAIMGLMSVIFFTSGTAQNNSENEIAYSAAASALEQIRQNDFGALWGDFGSLSTAQNFDVAGLIPVSTDTDGKCGKIILLVNEQYTGEYATELAFPRCINDDLDTADVNCSGDYMLLPVVVEIEWQGLLGRRKIHLSTLVGQRRDE